MFGRNDALIRHLVSATLDLNQRLTALEQNRVDDTLIADQNEDFLRQTLRDMQSNIHTLHARTVTLHGVVEDLTKTTSRLAYSIDSRAWTNGEANSALSRLVSKVETVVERQRAAEQLLDAIRVYAAEREARDGQTSKPDQSENGDCV